MQSRNREQIYGYQRGKGGQWEELGDWDQHIYTDDTVYDIDPLQKGMATHSSSFAWRIPWTEEPGSLQLTGSPRVRDNQHLQ